MSAPHWYETDRLCVVVSGTWWVASGEDFEPKDTVPMAAGSFIRRVARTPHYDGVKKDGHEPAVIAICGMGPITFHAGNSSQPTLRCTVSDTAHTPISSEVQNLTNTIAGFTESPFTTQVLTAVTSVVKSYSY